MRSVGRNVGRGHSGDELARPSRVGRIRSFWPIVFAATCAIVASTPLARAENLPADFRQEVVLAADSLKVWKEGDTRFFLLQGKCYVEQGLFRLRSGECLAWIADGSVGQPAKVQLFAKGDVRVESAGRRAAQSAEYRTTLWTTSEVRLQSKSRVNESAADHPLYAAALAGQDDLSPALPAPNAKQDGDVVTANLQQASNAAQPIQQAQFSGGGPTGRAGSFDGGPPRRPTRRRGNAGPVGIGPGDMASSGATRRISVSPRTTQPYHSDSFVAADGTRITVFTGGINLIVEELNSGQVVDIVADRVVLWSKGDLANPAQGGGAPADGRQPIEVYLEGNVIIRQGNPKMAQQVQAIVLVAKQAYFNVNTNQALALDAEVETIDPKFRIPLYMRSEQIRQLNPTKFYSKRASVTTSAYRGTPGYDFLSTDVFFEEVKERIKNPFTRADVIDPDTGQPMERTRHFATAFNNVLRVEDVPIFYWPYMKVDVEDPLGPVQTIRLGNSNNLGFISAVGLDIWELLGLDYLDIAERSNWIGDIGYFSRRGIAGGTRFNYFGGEPGTNNNYYGNILLWGIDDHGLDYLGPGRNGIAPPQAGRGRARIQHHQDLPNDFTFLLETSYLSDPNFLESLYEAEYDTGKDQDTLVYLKQARNQWAWSLLAQPRLNNFLPQNAWLPRGDFYLLGAPLFERFTYFTHSSLAYAQLLPPNRYTLPTDVTSQMGRVDTRHEIDYPTQLGDWQVTPFAVGEFTGYTNAIDSDVTPYQASGDPLGRFYAAGGIRTSLPFWKVYSGVENNLLNLHGLAHKVALNVDYVYAYSNQYFRNLPALDQADDDTSDLVRRQNILRNQTQLMTQFGTITPVRYDPRNYANRQGVTFLPEALDNLQAFRLGVNQVWQTKRGPAGNLHVLDWMILDLGASIFPERNRDNFGNYLGLVNGSYQWNIGDRTSILATGLYEPSDNTWTANTALYFQRPPRSLFSLFYSHYSSGPFLSDFVGGSTSYRMSPKYAGSLAVGTDLRGALAPSVTAGLSRVGLDFITTLGIVYNAGRGDFGFQFEIYPRAQSGKFNRSRLQTLPFGVDSSETAPPVVIDRLSILNNNFTPN